MHVLEPSTCIAHYCLQRRIARGGMSHVYLAQDIFTEQLVALKLVDKNQGEYYERLQREIRALLDLTHNHILPVLDYGPYHSWYYLATPYIEHGTLRERLAQSPLTIEEAGRILEQIASALQFAHDHGIIHRDIKPSNILLRDGEHVYLTDFGLVKLLDEASDITQTGCLLGTPAYVAPELIEHDATPRSDIYALGIVLYQMLTGHVPFKSTTPIGAYWKHLSASPQPPSMYNPAIPPAIDTVVLHALEKNPEHRFARADEFVQSYQQALIGARTITYPAIETQPVGTGFITSAHQYAFATGRRREFAVLLAAVIFFFITPLWLGFTYYSIHYRSELPALLHASVPLTVDHLPVVLDFPPAPLSHHQQPLPAITSAPPPPPALPGWSWSYQSPPPHKHQQKHKVSDKHKADDQQKQESQAEDRPSQNLTNSYPEQSSNQVSNMPQLPMQHVQQPDVRPLLPLQIP